MKFTRLSNFVALVVIASHVAALPMENEAVRSRLHLYTSVTLILTICAPSRSLVTPPSLLLPAALASQTVL